MTRHLVDENYVPGTKYARLLSQGRREPGDAPKVATETFRRETARV